MPSSIERNGLLARVITSCWRDDPSSRPAFSGVILDLKQVESMFHEDFFSSVDDTTFGDKLESNLSPLADK
jgi:hypothetical protein